MLTKVARRISDGNVLAMVKQFLKSTGDQGVPQGSPLSPLLANLALNDLDHMLDRGSSFITYARYLDDMVVLAPDSEKGEAWAHRALARIRHEAEAIGVSLNTEPSRLRERQSAHRPNGTYMRLPAIISSDGDATGCRAPSGPNPTGRLIESSHSSGNKGFSR
jgi:hypothetical protein